MVNRITKESMEFIAGEMAAGYGIFHRRQDSSNLCGRKAYCGKDRQDLV